MRTKAKYKIVGTQKTNRLIYHLVQVNNKKGKVKEKWVGINLLRRLYYQGQIHGKISDYLKYQLTGEKRKKRNKIYKVFDDNGLFNAKEYINNN